MLLLRTKDDSYDRDNTEFEFGYLYKKSKGMIFKNEKCIFSFFQMFFCRQLFIIPIVLTKKFTIITT